MTSADEHQNVPTRAIADARQIDEVVGAALRQTASATERVQVNDAIAFWQPLASRSLTTEDARQILENLRGFFEVLDEWDRAEQRAARSDRQKCP